MAKTSLTAKALPDEVQLSLIRLGARLRESRVARGWTLEQMSERVFVTSKTLRRLEGGDPGVSLATMTSCLFVLGHAGDVEKLLAEDRIAMSVREAGARRRARRGAPKPDLDF